MNLLILIVLWNWVAIPYAVFLIIQNLFPSIPSNWETFGYILLLMALINGRLNLEIQYKKGEEDA